MAIARYKTEKFATIELNHVSWPETARVFAQLPLDTNDFSEEAPCENGMWLVYDIVGGTARKPKDATENVGVMYLNEKEYNPYIGGLNQWALKPGIWYPRIGMPMVGDLYTTNCFCYDTTEFADDAAVDAALAKIDTTPVYFVPVAGEGAPKLTATLDATAAVAAKVVKFYTMPNGEKGVKVQFIKC